MKLVAQVLAEPQEPQGLLSMMRQFNAACNWLSSIAFEERLWHWLPLQRRAYHELRSRFGLTAAQATVAVRKVAYAYRNKARRSAVARFHPLGAVPLFQHRYREGAVLFYGQRAHYITRPGTVLPAKAPQATLLFCGGRFFIHQVVNTSIPSPYAPTSFLGCDLGVVNILTDSDGAIYSSGHLNGLRKRHAKLRSRLQAKGTRSATRLLRKRRQREGRFARWVNHNIARKVVAKANTRTAGIALEDLKGIRERVVVRKAQRRQHSSWSFDQLRQFIEYKAALAGAPIVLVDPRNTSRQCPRCGTVDKGNRLSQARFLCVSCAFAGHADTIAAVNIGRRALGNAPDAASVKDSCKSQGDLLGVRG